MPGCWGKRGQGHSSKGFLDERSDDGTKCNVNRLGIIYQIRKNQTSPSVTARQGQTGGGGVRIRGNLTRRGGSGEGGYHAAGAAPSFGISSGPTPPPCPSLPPRSVLWQRVSLSRATSHRPVTPPPPSLLPQQLRLCHRPSGLLAGRRAGVARPGACATASPPWPRSSYETAVAARIDGLECQAPCSPGNGCLSRPVVSSAVSRQAGRAGGVARGRNTARWMLPALMPRCAAAVPPRSAALVTMLQVDLSFWLKAGAAPICIGSLGLGTGSDYPDTSLAVRVKY